MKRNVTLWIIIMLFVTIFNCNIGWTKEWRFSLRLTYANGIYDVADLFEDNDKAQGLDADIFVLPVGLSFQSYLQFDSGVRVGGGIGPVQILWGWDTSSDSNYYDIPLNLNIGYTLITKKNISPYVFLGIAYHIAGGDYVNENGAGLLGGFGVKYSSDSKIAYGIELSFDTTELEFDKLKSEEVINYYGGSYRYTRPTKTTEKIKPYGFMISLFFEW